MIISTLETAPEGKDYEVLGIVFSDVCMGANVIKDMFASIGDKLGGRISSYEKVVKSSREKAVDDMVKSAESLNADAILGLDFKVMSLGKDNSIIQVTAKGTAVKFISS